MKITIAGIGEFEASEAVAHAVATLLRAQANCNHDPAEIPVYLVEVGPQKISTIKAIRQVTGLSLMHAKGLCDEVEGAMPGSIGKRKLIKRVSYADALKIRDFFREESPHARIDFADPLTQLAMQAV